MAVKCIYLILDSYIKIAVIELFKNQTLGKNNQINCERVTYVYDEKNPILKLEKWELGIFSLFFVDHCSRK